jgi:hypothetical protein
LNHPSPYHASMEFRRYGAGRSWPLPGRVPGGFLAGKGRRAALSRRLPEPPCHNSSCASPGW